MAELSSSSTLSDALKDTPSHLYKHSHIDCLMHEWMKRTEDEYDTQTMLQGYGQYYAYMWRKLLPRDRTAVTVCKTCAAYYAAHALAGTNPHTIDTDVAEKLRSMGIRVFRQNKFIGEPLS